jgi:hypothetical protein
MYSVTMLNQIKRKIPAKIQPKISRNKMNRVALLQKNELVCDKENLPQAVLFHLSRKRDKQLFVNKSIGVQQHVTQSPLKVISMNVEKPPRARDFSTPDTVCPTDC